MRRRDSLTWRDRFRLRVLRKPVDFGDGLSAVPVARFGIDQHTGLPYEQWAAQQWQAWTSGILTCCASANNARLTVCPACYEIVLREHALYLSQRHSDAGARRRWGNAIRVNDAKIAVLGPCRCGCRLTLGEAARIVHEDNRDRDYLQYGGDR